jgi:hypothetical protein
LDYANLAAFPVTGATDLIYLALDTAKIYYWDGAAYQEISPSTGGVTSVFCRTGVVTAATNDYTWAQIDKTTSSLADITTRSHTALTDIGTNSHATIDSHIASTSNPHSVTASQVGLGNVDNTSDVNKPVSTATQTALDLKENLSVTVEAKTANYSVLASDNKKVFTAKSNPAVDVTFTLPTCAAGLSFTFVKDVDKVLTITAAANDAIVYHQQSTALAGSIVLDNVGDSVVLTATDDDLWYAQPFDEKIRLAENKIFIGSTLGFAEGQTMSGDVTLSVSGTAVIGANAVLLGKIAQSTVGTCLIGRSAATTGDFGEIAATENGQSLYRTGGILAFSHGVGQGTNTSDADCVVDANLYDAFSWVFTSSAGTGRNLQIDNLVAGRKVRIFVKNDSGSNAATIRLIASTTTSGHSNVVLAGGAVNTFSAAINGVYKQIDIINISGTFFATVIG